MKAVKATRISANVLRGCSVFRSCRVIGSRFLSMRPKTRTAKASASRTDGVLFAASCRRISSDGSTFHLFPSCALKRLTNGPPRGPLTKTTSSSPPDRKHRTEFTHEARTPSRSNRQKMYRRPNRKTCNNPKTFRNRQSRLRLATIPNWRTWLASLQRWF